MIPLAIMISVMPFAPEKESLHPSAVFCTFEKK